MLVMNIEVWPFGAENQKRKIGQITAGNISGGMVCTYEIRVHQEAYEPAGVPEICEDESGGAKLDHGSGGIVPLRAA